MSQEMRNPINPRQIDMLVDGQLSEEARRELLSRMDIEPGAWRRCALGFLEAQCWRESLAPVARSAGEPAGAQPAALPRRRVSRWAGGLAVAASFLVAFGLGILARPVWRPSAPRVEQVAGHDQSEADLRGVLPASASPWRVVTLTSPDNPSNPIRLPAMERKRIDDNWLRSFPNALPSDVLRALERTGHSVQQSRELLPVPLDDGRRLVVPVDQVEVHSVGRYQ
jgi:anti-sigma factor RsiW